MKDQIVKLIYETNIIPWFIAFLAVVWNVFQHFNNRTLKKKDEQRQRRSETYIMINNTLSKIDSYTSIQFTKISPFSMIKEFDEKNLELTNIEDKLTANVKIQSKRDQL